MKTSFRPVAIVAILAQLGIASCVNTEHETTTSSVDPRTQFTPPNGKGQRVNGATVLNTVRTTHFFSDPGKADAFVLQMRGPRILTSQVHFFIVSSHGDTLRHEVLPARIFLDDPALRDNAAASVRDREISILRGMNSFFTADKFVQPAVPADSHQPAELDTKVWTSLRNDPTAVGFDYTAASGGKRLAYSRQLGRAVLMGD
ncbi:MAG: hypothetical protein ACRYFX_05500 [Janthinobacterium lividum]